MYKLKSCQVAVERISVPSKICKGSPGSVSPGVAVYGLLFHMISCVGFATMFTLPHRRHAVKMEHFGRLRVTVRSLQTLCRRCVTDVLIYERRIHLRDESLRRARGGVIWCIQTGAESLSLERGAVGSLVVLQP